MSFILGPRSPAFDFLCAVPGRFHLRRGFVLVAWARRAGVGLLYTALGDSLRNVDVVVGMAGRGTSAEALAHLRALGRRTFVYHKHHRQTFHPKLYLFDDGSTPPTNAALLVGSSNLTGGGLYQNIEGNLALTLQPSRRADHLRIYDSAVEEINDLLASPFCEELTTDDRIRELLEDRYISTERALARRRARDARDAARRGQRRQRPEAPPPPLLPFALPLLTVAFGEAGDEEAAPGPAPIQAPDLVIADPGEQFYVRTLTDNDVNKLHGRTPGTAEWDIGETARDAMPAFWGWPNEYQRVQRQVERLEWATSGTLRSSSTPIAGVEVDVVLWYREARPGHAAEHRLRIGPRPTLVGATPDHFDTSSLVVVERLPEGTDHTFLVQLLTRIDPGYADYARYLRHDRPQHRYGYGP